MARSGVIYGASNSRKTTQVGQFAKYIYDVTGKRTKLLSLDGGGWQPIQPEVDGGLIDPYRCTLTIPLPVLRKISQGYWPEDATQTISSNINLIPIDWNEFGGIAVEGMTSISQALMRYLADNAIIVAGERTPLGNFGQKIHVEGKEVIENFAGSSQGHYGFVQNQLYSLTMNFNSLPAYYVLFTAHESRTEEDDRSTVYGPAIAGKKATALVPSWVGDCIHMQDYSREKTVKHVDPQTKLEVEGTIVETVVRGYFMKHPDPSTGILFPAKPRVHKDQIAALMKIYPGGFYGTELADGGLYDYLLRTDELTKSQVDSVKTWREQMDAKHGRGKQAAQGLEKKG